MDPQTVNVRSTMTQGGPFTAANSGA